MCSLAACSESQFYTPGDSEGLRRQYQSGGPYEPRRVYHDADIYSFNQPSWTMSATGKAAIFAPRIDCAKGASPQNSCGMVIPTRDSIGSQYSVVRLNTPQGESWSEQDIIRSAAATIAMPPDITLDSSGQFAYVVRSDDGGFTYVERISMATGTRTNITYLNANPVLPPRISWSEGRAHVLILDRNPGNNGVFSAPAWKLFTVASNGYPAEVFFTPATATGDDLDNASFYQGTSTVSDFDFDCRPAATGETEDNCTIVALLRADDDDPGALRSIRYHSYAQYWPFYSFTVQLKDETWDKRATYSTNAVTGVTYDQQKLIVSAGRRISSSTHTTNTLLLRLNGDRVSNSIDDVEFLESDGSSCQQTSSHGITMPGTTTHGGTSVAWCEECSTSGTLHSVTWGIRADNDSFCH